ncbi:Spata31d1d [Phodopus roborovskii]|uniref:Spata31d1d protein n=1 Tax=Phodopus roborovskii TaxID=109678 RepID=A0AAU9ZMC7_PHORO|nr:Spata31d1d [Phodopus roborovskii]
MEKVLSFLSSATEPWLSFGRLSSAFVDIYPKCIFLSAVGVLLLYLRYPILKPFLPTWSNQDTGKQQGKAKKGRRAPLKEFRVFHREVQERRKLLSVMQSPFGQLYDASHFRQVLCPDPCCDVCNGATAKVSRLLLRATLEEGAVSASSVVSTASATETSFTLSPPLSPSPPGCQISSPSPFPPLSPSPSPSLPPPPPPPPPSIVSTNEVTPLEDTLLCTPQGDSLPSEPVLESTGFPLDHIPPHPPPTVPSEAEPTAPQTEGSSQLATIPSMVDSLSAQFVNARTHKEARGDVSGLSTPQSGCVVNPHSSEAFLGGATTVYFTVPGKPSFPSPQVLEPFERQGKGQADFLTLEDGKGNAESFQRLLTAWEGIPKSKLQDSGGSLPLEDIKGRVGELVEHQGLGQAQVSEDQSEPKLIQHFWGLPYLHSESMHTITTLSTHCSSACIWFNRVPDSSLLTCPRPLSLPESQSQSFLLATSQNQLQPPIPVPPSSPQSPLRICGVYFHRPKDETRALLQPKVHPADCSALTKEPERVWGLPSTVQNSQEKFCLPPSKPSFVRQSPKTHTPKSVPPGNFPLTDAFRKKLEYHLRKRLILQHQGLSHRVFKSQPWVSPDLAESPMGDCRLSGVSVFQHQDSKDPHDSVSNQPGSSQERCPERVSLEGTVAQTLEQSSETVHRHLRGNSEGAVDNGLQSDCETNPQGRPGSLSGKPSGSSQVSQCQKKLETVLKKRLIRHLKETREGQLSGAMPRSGHCPLPSTSCMGKKEHEASDNKDGHVMSKYKMLQRTPIILDNTSQEESESNKHSPDVPRISNEPDPVPWSKRLYFSKTVRGTQDSKVNDTNIFVSNKVSNTVKGGQLSGLQPQPTKIMNTSRCKSTQGADGNITKVQSTLVAGRALKETSGPQESQIYDCNSQVSREQKLKSESRLPIQVLRHPNDKLPASDEFSYKPFPVHDQSPSRGSMNASQGLRQETWMAPHVLDHNKDIPPPAKKIRPPPWKTEELWAGVATSGTSLQANGKSRQAQDAPIQGNHGEKAIQPLPAKAQSPPEHQFRKHFKQLLQRLSPDRKCKGPEMLLRKGSPPSPVQDPELLKGRVIFPGNTIAQKPMRDPRKVSREQLGHRYGAADTTRPRVPLSPPTKPVKTKPKKESRVSAQPVQARSLYHQVAYPKVPSPSSYSRSTTFVGQRRQGEDRDRQPHKGVVSQPGPPASCVGPEVHRSLLSRFGQVPRAVPSLAVGTVLTDLSRLCEQKILTQNCSGKSFLPQK